MSIADASAQSPIDQLRVTEWSDALNLRLWVDAVVVMLRRHLHCAACDRDTVWTLDSIKPGDRYYSHVCPKADASGVIDPKRRIRVPWKNFLTTHLPKAVRSPGWAKDPRSKRFPGLEDTLALAWAKATEFEKTDAETKKLHSAI
ncbi:hypothetical protein OC834_007990, partial [Tilletia horrida]